MNMSFIRSYLVSFLYSWRSYSLCLSLLFLFSGCANESSPYFEVKTNKAFAQVIEDLEFAVSERNFRITNTLHIGKGLKTRGHIDFPENSVVLFCNLKLAKKMLELDPYYLNHCPYRVTLREMDNQVIINARLLPEAGTSIQLDKLIDETNTLLREIVELGAELWQE